MPITVPVNSATPTPATLMFPCGAGSQQKQIFGISIEDTTPPLQPHEIVFEALNTSGNPTPNWGCKIAHQDGSYLEIWIAAGGSSNIAGVEFTAIPGGFVSSAVGAPDADSWIWPDGYLHIYFWWECSDGSQVEADNTGSVPGVEAGFPLMVAVGGSPGGKKIRVLYPGPAGTKAE